MAERHQVQSNSAAHKLAVYSGIGLAGIGVGAAIAVSNDPIYDGEKAARGKPVKRNVPWDSKYIPLGLESSVDQELHDMFMKQGNLIEAGRIERQARRNFEAKSYEHQKALVHAFENPVPEIKGSFRAKMLMKARKLVSKL